MAATFRRKVMAKLGPTVLDKREISIEITRKTHSPGNKRILARLYRGNYHVFVNEFPKSEIPTVGKILTEWGFHVIRKGNSLYAGKR